MRAQELMSSDIACCTADSSLQEVARMMANCDCGAIPVIDRDTQRLQGVITDRDIACRAVAEGRDPSSTRVGDIMSTNIVAAKPDDDANEVIHRMEKAQVRRIPITDGDGRCIGIIAQADIARSSDQEHRSELLAAVSESTRNASAAGMRAS